MMHSICIKPVLLFFNSACIERLVGVQILDALGDVGGFPKLGNQDI